jgi:hypothetical protein
MFAVIVCVQQQQRQYSIDANATELFDTKAEAQAVADYYGGQVVNKQ